MYLSGDADSRSVWPDPAACHPRCCERSSGRGDRIGELRPDLRVLPAALQGISDASGNCTLPTLLPHFIV